MDVRGALARRTPKGLPNGALLLILLVAIAAIGTAERCELTCEDRAYNDCVEKYCDQYRNSSYYAECVDDCDKYSGADCID